MSFQVAKNIVQQRTDVLLPYARNSRTHSDEQVSQIAASIREFGFTNPVLVDSDNGIVAGHGRVMAAKQLGLTEVPTINVGWMTEGQRRAYVIADNQLALNAGWDNSVLAQEVAWLQDQQFDTNLLGFNADFLDGLLAEEAATDEGLTDQDDAPAVQADPITRLGDVWVMGKHRLMCGDSTSMDSVATLAQGGGH
jgi:ParB-like chromosome segregation protein Spo0J